MSITEIPKEEIDDIGDRELILEQLYLIRDGLSRYKNNKQAIVAAIYVNGAICELLN